MDQNKALRDHLVDLLTGENAHINLENAIAGVPPAIRGKRPSPDGHSPWELLEHMRIAQRDILEFSRNARHVSPKFPEGYWPKAEAPADGEWDKSVASFKADLQAMCDLVSDPATDLFAPIRHG